jgi:hypothetical protein
VGPFTPPKGFFFVRVNGEDEQNYEVSANLEGKIL